MYQQLNPARHPSPHRKCDTLPKSLDKFYPDHFHVNSGVEINLMNELGIIDIDLHDLAGNTAKIIAHLNGVVAIMERSVGIGNGKFPIGSPGNWFPILEPLIG